MFSLGKCSMTGYSLVWLLMQEIERLKMEIGKLTIELQSYKGTKNN